MVPKLRPYTDLRVRTGLKETERGGETSAGMDRGRLDGGVLKRSLSGGRY